jgi:hypothetical protein
LLGAHAVIPAFRSDGTLPVGRHESNPAEIEQRLVQTFPLSMTRADIYRGWRARRQVISQVVPIDMEWIDGSFATAKRDPGDIDVATFIQGGLLDNLQADGMQQLDGALRGLRVKLRFGCDAYLIPVRPSTHPLAHLYQLYRGYWDHWWSHDEHGAEKGYVSVRGEP